MNLKTYADGSFDIEIKSVVKKSGLLRVRTRCPYGEDDLGLGLHTEYLDVDGIPKWRKEVKKLIEKKYGRHIGNNQTDSQEVEVFSDHKGIIKSDDLEKTNKLPKKRAVK